MLSAVAWQCDSDITWRLNAPGPALSHVLPCSYRRARISPEPIASSDENGRGTRKHLQLLPWCWAQGDVQGAGIRILRPSLAAAVVLPTPSALTRRAQTQHSSVWMWDETGCRIIISLWRCYQLWLDNATLATPADRTWPCPRVASCRVVSFQRSSQHPRLQTF